MGLGHWCTATGAEGRPMRVDPQLSKQVLQPAQTTRHSFNHQYLAEREGCIYSDQSAPNPENDSGLGAAQAAFGPGLAPAGPDGEGGLPLAGGWRHLREHEVAKPLTETAVRYPTMLL